MGVFGVIGPLCFFLTFALVRENNLQDSEKSVSLKEAVGSLAVNTPWKLFALNIMFMWTGFFIQSAALIYYYKYYVGSTYLTSLVATIMTMVPMVANLTVPFLAKRLGKRNLYIASAGLLSSVNGFLGKVAQALAGGLGGMLLAWGMYNADAETQTADALTAIKAMYLYIPMVLLVCSIITMSFYKLDEQFPQIQADLAKRRGK